MVTTIKNPTTGEVLPQFTMYRYDQLNRLKNMKAFADFNFSNNEWNYSGYDGRYFNEFTYDGNGNIETQLRMDEAGNAINNLTYQRLRTPQGLKQNRLYHVNDAIDAQAFEDDIDDQGEFNGDASTINTANNYAYDELGNLTRNTQKEIAEIKWTVYGKVQEVVRTQGSSKKNLKFEYNATGQRTAKHVYNNAWKREYSDYYVYDAQGNMMSIYRLSVDEQQQTAAYTLTERPMYGSSRLGVDKATLEFVGYTPPTNNLTNHILGLKQYSGSNHLGNVLTTFSDKKIPVDNNGTIAYYNADVTSSTDYYPFGVTMKGRDFNSSTNRFGFNSMEKIEETETMDFGARLLDGDLGVWLALDPFYMEFTSWSPYSYAYNNPMSFIDKKGEKPYVSVVWSEDKTKATITITNYLYVYETGKGSPEPLCATDIVEHLPGNTFFLENVEVELNINVEVVNVKNKREAKQRIRENGDYGVIVNNSTRRGDSYHQPKGRYDYIKLHPGYTLISQVAAHELGHDLGFSDKYILVGKLPYSIFPFTKMLMSTGENKLSEFEQLTIIFDVLYNNSLELNNGRPVRTDLEIIPKGEEIITTSPEGHKYKTIIKDNYGTHEGEFNEED